MLLDRPSEGTGCQGWLRRSRVLFFAVTICGLFLMTPAVAFQNAPIEAMPVAQPVSAPGDATGNLEPPKTFLQWLIDASGPFGACVFVESFIMVSLVIMCLLQLRRPVFMPPLFLEEFEGKLAAFDYQGAYNRAKDDESLLARLLVVGMTKLQKGPEEALTAMSELGEDENMALEHRLSWLALIATTAPMFGLLGTVQGMVQAFDEIASSSTTPKPSELAQGIQLALVTTLEGLIVAIPAIIAYSLLRNHLIRLMFDIGHQAEDLLTRIQARPVSVSPPGLGTQP